MKVGKLLLYHGSDQQIDRPEWNHGSRYRDFGQCFYTTHSRAMASNWAEKNFMLHPYQFCVFEDEMQQIIKTYTYAYSGEEI
jgi:hypothetical protein